MAGANVFGIILMAAVLANAFAAPVPQAALIVDEAIRIEGTRATTGADFLRWLAALKHCTSGKVCAMYATQTCAWTDGIFDQPISQPSLVVQNHRGSSASNTFVLGRNGDLFLNIAQEDQMAIIPMTAENFPNNAVVIASQFPLTVDASALDCTPFGEAAFQTIMNETETDFAVCIDLTEPITKSADAANCGVYIVQTAKMTTALEVKQQKYSDKLNQDIVGAGERLVELFETNTTGCLNDTIQSAFNSCKQNSTATTSASNFVSCVKAYQYKACLNFEDTFQAFKKQTLAHFIDVVNQANITINGSTPANITVDPVTQQLVSSALPATALTFLGGYSGYKTNLNAECGAGIARAVGKCALNAVKNALIAEIGLNALTAAGASFQQSVLYHESPAPKPFTESAGATEAGIGVITGGFVTGNVAGCIIGTVRNLVACRKSKSGDEDNNSESDENSYEEIDSDRVRGTEFESPPEPYEIPVGGFQSYFSSLARSRTTSGDIEYNVDSGLTREQFDDINHYEFDTGNFDMMDGFGSQNFAGMDNAVYGLRFKAEHIDGELTRSYEDDMSELESSLESTYSYHPNSDNVESDDEDPDVVDDDIPDVFRLVHFGGTPSSQFSSKYRF